MFTDPQIKRAIKKAKDTAKPADLSSLISGKGSGSLLLRVSARGTAKWSVKFIRKGDKETIPIGEYPAITLKNATLRAIELSEIHVKGVSVKEHLKVEQRVNQAGTLKELIDNYVNKFGGEGSGQAAKSYLNRHVVKAFPELAESQASVSGEGSVGLVPLTG